MSLFDIDDDGPDPFGRVHRPRDDRRHLFDGTNIYDLSDSVGFEGSNHPRDVAKIEALLGATGDLDLRETGGPTGFAGVRTDLATRRFQKRHGLLVDGLIKRNGPTIRALASVLNTRSPVSDSRQPVEDDGDDGGDDGGSDDSGPSFPTPTGPWPGGIRG